MKRHVSNLERGQRVTEILKQKQYAPLSVAEMAVLLFAVDKGYLDDVELNKIVTFSEGLLAYMHVRTNELFETD